MLYVKASLENLLKDLKLTFNAPGIQIIVFGHMIVVRVVEESFWRNATNVQTSAAKSVIFLNTHSLSQQSTHQQRQYTSVNGQFSFAMQWQKIK